MTAQLDFFAPRPAVAPFTPTSAALLSPCGLYRYTLTRRWGEGAPMLFVMLNPSTADAAQDDPTIRRCVGFAKREGFGAIEVVNLFAYRATDPKVLAGVGDFVGPDNDTVIRDARGRAGLIVAAWGSSVPAALRQRVRHIAMLLGPGALCFGVTADGSPRHPLYVKGDTAFVSYAARDIARSSG